MRVLMSYTAALCLGLGPAGLLLAQQLTLFEPLQQTDSAPDGSRMGPAPAIAAMPGTAGLALRSSARFGRVHQVVLSDASGNDLALQWQAGERVAVPQHPGYVVTGVNGMEVTLQHPAGQPCQDNDVSGVRCLSGDTAVLSLATLSPLPKAPSPMGPEPQRTEDGDIIRTDANGNTVFINPFSAAAMEAEELTPEQQQDRAARAQARQQRLQQFQIERIPDDQIPPGMRRVRTPFGDRLVPIRE